MAVKTKAEIAATLATRVPDNSSGQITPASLRAQFNDIAESAAFLSEIGDFAAESQIVTTARDQVLAALPQITAATNTTTVAAADAAQSAAAAVEISGAYPRVSRSVMKALDTATNTVALLNEPTRVSQWRWDATVPVATHQADAYYEADYIAPNPAADGAWTRQHWERSFPIQAIDIAGAANRHLEREPKKPHRFILADPSLASVNETEAILLGAASSAPYPLLASGGKWWDMSSRTELTPWWVPAGASLVIDRKRGRYYWGGAVKTAGDLTAQSTGWYMSDVAWLDPSHWTLLAEWDTPDSGAFTSNETVFSLCHTDDGTQRFDLTISSESTGQPSFGLAGGGAFTTYNPLLSLPHDQDIAPMLGRRRAMFSATAGVAPLTATDGFQVTQTGAVAASITANRVTLGYRQLAGSSDQYASASIVASTMIVAWPFAMTQAQMERAVQNSLENIPPIHFLGDSFGNGETYANGGGLPDKIRKLIKARGYACWAEDVVGGTSLTQQAVRFDAYPRYWDSTLIMGEFGLDGTGEQAIAAMKQMISRLSHNRWCIVEPCYDTNARKGTPARFLRDEYVRLMREFAGDHFLPTKTLMQAAALPDTYAQDATDLADDVWMTRLSVDGLHQLNAGREVLAQIVFDWLVAKGWL